MEAKDAITCARGGDVDFFNTVAREILLKARDERDRSVLTVAALNGHLDCCKVIVESCTQLLYHQNDSPKWSVLHYVAVDNKHENIMRFLITADSKQVLELGGGAKIPNKRLLAMQDYWDSTALHRAVEYRKHWATKLLLQADHNFELLRMVDKDGRTCLHIAVEKGDHVLVELMIKTKPDNEFLKMTESKWNQTALHIAAQNQNLAIVELLIEADHSNNLLAMVDSNQQTALHIAVKRGNPQMVLIFICDADPDKQLLSMPDGDGNTLLHLAVKTNQFVIVQMLLEVGNCDLHQRTALHYAVEQGNLDMVKLMCKEGFDKQLLSMPDSQGNTPLHLAPRYCKVEMVRLLTEEDMAIPCAKRGNADFFEKVAPEILLRARDAGGINTVLTVAAREGHLDCCKVIVERCPSLLYHQDKYKWSVLHDVVRYSKDNLENILRFLITVDSQPDLELGGGAKIPNKRLLMMQTKWGGTALHLAVRFGKHRATELLLQAYHGLELPQMVDNNGRTCLHIAAEKGDHVSVKLLEKMAV